MNSNNKDERFSAPELERSIIVFLLKNGDDQRFAKLLRDIDFTDSKLQTIFKTIDYFWDKSMNYDINLVTNKLKEDNEYDKLGGAHFFADLINYVPKTPHSIDYYIKKLTEKTSMRQTKDVLNQSIKDLNNPNLDISEIIGSLQSRINDIWLKSDNIDKFTNINEISKDIFQYLIDNRNKDSPLGLSSGFSNLDDMISGFQPGELFILAARPSVGKTAFALNLARNICENGDSVLFFSLEMSDKDLVTRILSLETNINATLFKTPKYLTNENFNRIKATVDQISRYDLVINDSGSINIDEIYWQVVKNYKNKSKKYKLIIFDYLQLINSSQKIRGDSRQVEVSIISRKLKQLAREVNTPIIALSQLSRSVEKREDKMPVLSDLRESGAIEQDADVVGFLYRDDYYGKKEDNHNGNQSITQLKIAKNRNGPTGIIEFAFYPEKGLFSEQERNSVDTNDFED